MIFRGKAHEVMFRNAIAHENNSDRDRLAVIYLLTGDKFLWSKVRQSGADRDFDFSAVHLASISPDAYTLFMTARDLYEGTKHISVSDIADRNIVSHKIFGIICDALSICRYGLIGKDGK